MTRMQCSPNSRWSNIIRLQKRNNFVVTRSDEHLLRHGDKKYRNIKYLRRIVDISHPHEQLLLQLIKTSVVITGPFSGRVLGPGLDTGVTIGHQDHVLQTSSAVLQDVLDRRLVGSRHWTIEDEHGLPLLGTCRLKH